jgi:hypothetical protein
MKRIFAITTVLLCLASLFSVPAFAGWSFHIANDDMDPTWEIWLLTDEILETNGYGLAFNYDYQAGQLTWNGSYSNTPPTGLTANLPFPASENPAKGTISNFNALRFSELTTISDSIQLGTITFSYANRVPTAGDLVWDIDNLFFSVYINGTSYTGQQLFANDQLTVVPIPAAIWLLGCGLVGIAGLKQKRR